MSAHVKAWARAGLVTMLLAAPVAADDASVRKDLTSVIALQGLPCAQVVSFVRQGENDYIASCQDGNRYHVFINPQGRVVVQRL